MNKSFSELKETVDAMGLMFSQLKEHLNEFKSIKKYKKIYFVILNLKSLE